MAKNLRLNFNLLFIANLLGVQHQRHKCREFPPKVGDGWHVIARSEERKLTSLAPGRGSSVNKSLKLKLC